ncbi:HEXXH motif-containing putative peptide modification protein [Streptomyces sp. NPDC057654]|uniref:aKG-HExxH-type peptide beta-hydroxylase n=1 Tax=Streptomyces sp. NPDC057654 TaxID=3346196 RepID=UPI0036AF549C
MPPQLLAALARTQCPPAAAELLTASQYSKRLLLLRALADEAGADPRFDAHWSLLAAAERADPRAVRQVIGYPLVGAWAVRALRLVHGDDAPSETAAPAEVGLADGLAALAAAAAVRAGVPFRVRLPLRRGALVLPSVGAVTHPTARDVLIEGGRGDAPCPPGFRWLPLTALPPAGPHAAAVPFDDLDPHRAPDGGSGPAVVPTDRATAADRDRWHTLWRDAMALLERAAPERAAELTALLGCVVPLRTPAAGLVAATMPDAFGAAFTSRPTTAVDLAATLAHEIQHSKLAAVLDLVPLHRAGPEPRHWAPWRPDPRPFGGLLQGLYAHVALADLWGRIAALRGPEERAAWDAHARCWAQAGAVLPGLVRAPELTPEGREFAHAMADAYARLPAYPGALGPRARAAAEVEAARRVRIGRRMGTALR